MVFHTSPGLVLKDGPILILHQIGTSSGPKIEGKEGCSSSSSLCLFPSHCVWTTLWLEAVFFRFRDSWLEINFIVDIVYEHTHMHMCALIYTHILLICHFLEDAYFPYLQLKLTPHLEPPYAALFFLFFNQALGHTK